LFPRISAFPCFSPLTLNAIVIFNVFCRLFHFNVNSARARFIFAFFFPTRRRFFCLKRGDGESRAFLIPDRLLKSAKYNNGAKTKKQKTNRRAKRRFVSRASVKRRSNAAIYRVND
jgi:hypothetical protein